MAAQVEYLKWIPNTDFMVDGELFGRFARIPPTGIAPLPLHCSATSLSPWFALLVRTRRVSGTSSSLSSWHAAADATSPVQ